jgi:hypothetical protein
VTWHRPLLAAFAGCILALTLTSCAEIIQLLPPSGPPLTSASDPGIKAAGESSAAVDKDKQAQAVLSKAIEARNPKALDEAIKLRPQDPSYLLAQYVLQGAVGGIPNPALLQQALGLIYAQHPELAVPDQLQLAYIYYLDVLVTTNKFPKGSAEWKVLHDSYYCTTLSEYRAFLGSERADLLYSGEDCPQTRPGR